MLYVYCCRLLKAPALLRVSDNKLNPSHRGRDRGRGRPGCGVDGGPALATEEQPGPGHRAQAPTAGHSSPPSLDFWPRAVEESCLRDAENPTQSGFGYMYGPVTGSPGWRSCLLRLHGLRLWLHSLPLPRGPHLQAPSQGGYMMAAAAGASGPLRFWSRRTEQESVPSIF